MSGTPVRAPGTPCWVDLSTPDLEASKAFYGQLLGWDAETVAPAEAGSYTMFSLGGREVAAVSTQMDRAGPPAWQVYVATDSADATAQRVRDAGGEVLAAPMDVFDSGRMAVFRDPTGAVFAVWQSGEHHGAAVMREPNSFAWAELATRDIEGAKEFYGRIFGWTPQSSPMGEGQPEYTELKLDGTSVAGAMDVTGRVPDEVPANWLPYFAVADIDAAAARAGELGGTARVPPTAFPGGRFAIFSDPQGATFGLLHLAG